MVVFMYFFAIVVSGPVVIVYLNSSTECPCVREALHQASATGLDMRATAEPQTGFGSVADPEMRYRK